MRKLFSLILLLTAAISTRAAGTQNDKPIHILTVSGQSYTNVVFEQVTETHVFFKHAGGMSSVRIADLNPQLQKQLGYDPVKGAALLREQAQAQTYAAENSSSLRKTATGGASASEANTNNFKPGWGTVTKDFLIGKNEKLTLTFPNRWLYDCQSTGDAASPGAMLRFGPQSGSNFVVVVNTLSPSNNLVQMGSARLINMVAGESAARAVEKPVVQTLGGAETSGNYFSYTRKAYVDKEPKPGAFRYEMQGMVNMTEISLYFTVLFNYKDGGEDNETLNMIRSAHLSRKDDER